MKIIKMQNFKPFKSFKTYITNVTTGGTSTTGSSSPNSATEASGTTKTIINESETSPSNELITKTSTVKLRATVSDDNLLPTNGTTHDSTTNSHMPQTAANEIEKLNGTSQLFDNHNSINARFQKTLQDSTKRFSNIFRVSSAKQQQQQPGQSSTPSKNTKRNRPKFLKSKSADHRDHNQNERGSLYPNGSSLSKKELLQSDHLSADQIIEYLIINLDNMIEYFHSPSLNEQNSASIDFMQSTEASASTYYRLAEHAKHVLFKCLLLYKKIEENATAYDFERHMPSNGYRSLLKIFESCCRRLLFTLIDINEKKSTFLFQLKLMNSTIPNAINTNIKEFQTWIRLMQTIEILLQIGCDMMQTNQSGLFVHANQFSNSTMESNLFDLASIHQEAFFGRACGFQFSDSLQIPLTGCAVALASYNDGYEAFTNKENINVKMSVTASNMGAQSELETSNQYMQINTISNTVTQAVKSMYNGTKYIMDPESRAKKMSHVMRNANVEFCKAFWQLTETSIVEVGAKLLTGNVTVNVLKRIELAPLKLPKVKENSSTDTDVNEFVQIDLPTNYEKYPFVNVRILSSEVRNGMQELDKLTTVESAFTSQTSLSSSSFNPNQSKYLILHAHGGGFIAHSSKSHEIYLKPWCKELKVPIVSIDYSLAPEHPFPRASEECFYVYAWCLNNAKMLGWTGEKIICVGDSAGGVLVTNIVQRAILNNVRIPDALIPIYAPFLLSYTLSPSRLMSVMDPLLNLGILWRCLAAYCGIDFKLETEKYKKLLNIKESGLQSKGSTNSSKDRMSIKMSKSASMESNPNNEDKINVMHENSNRNDSVLFKTGSSENSSEDLKRLSNEKHQDEKQANELDTERLLHLHRLIGDSVFLIETLKNHPLVQNHFMSPYLTNDSVLAKFPRTCLIACADAFLDDNIEFAKRLNRLNVKRDVFIVDNGSPHGFLNMQTLVMETQEAHKETMKYLNEIIAEIENQNN